MKLFTIALLTLLAVTAGPLHAAPGHGMHNAREMMNHANPMPNLMMIIKRHGDQLNLTEQQSQDLAKWRDANHGPMHARVQKVHELEKAMYEASVAGKSKKELMAMVSELLQVRKEIISGKIDCRDNMRRILNKDQYAKVLSLYSGS
jgi:Spy/CpxP family protein refolding chaperone